MRARARAFARAAAYLACARASRFLLYSHDSIISTVSIKRTVWIFLTLSLLNVLYDLISKRLYGLILLVITK